MLVTNPLDPRGFTAKVADAGLLPLLNLLQTHASTRQRRYMRVQPPEVVQSGLKIPAGDVYSFAMVMWQLWTGEQAYKGMDMHVFHREIVEDGKRPDPPEDMPSKYAALMQACWAADPTSRSVKVAVAPKKWLE